MGIVWPVSGYVREGEPCHESGWPLYFFGVIALTNNFGFKELQPSEVPHCSEVRVGVALFCSVEASYSAVVVPYVKCSPLVAVPCLRLGGYDIIGRNELPRGQSVVGLALAWWGPLPCPFGPRLTLSVSCLARSLRIGGSYARAGLSV